MSDFKFEMPSTVAIDSYEVPNTSSCATIEKLSLEEARAAIANSSTPVIIKFFAPWCGACKESAPAVQEASCNYRDSARFISVDVEDAEALATEHGIDSLPTVAVFKGGKQGERREGSGSVAEFTTLFKKMLGK